MKNGMVEPTCRLFEHWKANGMPVNLIRCDNAGENKLLIETANGDKWKLNITPEYTARSTPQQNSKVEKGFDIVKCRGNAMFNAAYIPRELRYKLHTECFGCATLLDGLTVVTIDDKTATRFEHWNGKLPLFAQAQHMKIWGEAGAVKLGNK